MTCRTRFAPSPTGFLHIGGARTALYCYLESRRRKGVFVLRIEDTDRERSTQAAVDAILHAMDWLGLEYNEGPIYQTDRLERYKQVAEQLVAEGKAYYAYESKDELEAMRNEALEKNEKPRYNGAYRDANAPLRDDPNRVIRFRNPQDGTVAWDDSIKGRIEFSNTELDDLVIFRSDGYATYNFAVVVDDLDMGITDVIRGDDHLNNAFRQIALIRGMGWPEPIYAHVPLIHGADGAKLSKRHGALGVDAYRDDMGYLPEAINNYLMKLGWGHGDDEIISRDQALEWFDVADVGRGAARFDFKKLENLNGHYIREADDARLAHLCQHRLESALGRALTEADMMLLAKAMPVIKVRAKTMIDVAEGAQFLFEMRPISMDEKAASLLDGDALSLLEKALEALKGQPVWDMALLEEGVKAVAEEAGLGLGKIAQPLRAALTGRGTSPGIFDVLVLLGREESLARIEDSLARGA